MKIRQLATLLATLLVSTTAVAADNLEIAQPWARATPGSHVTTGAAYLEIISHGAADELVAISTPVATRTEVHTTKMTGGMMKMERVDALAIAAGGAVSLNPGGSHVMLIGLVQPLREGDRFPLTLTFRNAGDIEVEVIVVGVGAMGPGAGHGTHRGH